MAAELRTVFVGLATLAIAGLGCSEDGQGTSSGEPSDAGVGPDVAEAVFNPTPNRDAVSGGEDAGDEPPADVPAAEDTAVGDDGASPADTPAPEDTPATPDEGAEEDASAPGDVQQPEDTTPDEGDPPGCGACPDDRPFCVDGACRCSGDSCGPGLFCNEAGACAPCDVDQACTEDCLNCLSFGQMCSADGGECITCDDSTPCSGGFTCLDGSCEPCNTADACGTDCEACGGETPACVSGKCACEEGSCGAGEFCSNLSCAPCAVDTHCGPGCTDCTATEHPVCVQGSCRCTSDAQCGAGKWCNSGACEACTDGVPLHCGPSCAVCEGATPLCEGGSCKCTSSGDCGPGYQCISGGCEPCDTAATCGPECEPCGGAEPYCAPDGSACVACLQDGDCPDPEFCADGVCTSCQAQGCAVDSSPDGRDCGTAKVVGRSQAGGSNALFLGFLHSGLGNEDDLPSSHGGSKCWDAKYDEHFRIYLLAGETIDVEARNVGSNLDLMMKLYAGTSCASNWQAEWIGCYQESYDGGSESFTYTAQTEGWHTIVVDGRHASDFGQGEYDLVVELTCNQPGCCCTGP